MREGVTTDVVVATREDTARDTSVAVSRDATLRLVATRDDTLARPDALGVTREEAPDSPLGTTREIAPSAPKAAGATNNNAKI